MAKKMKTEDTYTLTIEEKKLLNKITDCYRSSYLAKQQLGMDSLWQDCQRYWSGEVNLPESDDDPGSETNVVMPIIESQVADIVNGEMDILVKGVGPSDAAFAKDTNQVLKWIWSKNNMINKLDSSERDRLNLGTVIWKTWYDKNALSGRGLITSTPFSPDSFFPDPKITDVDNLQDADFCIQTHWMSKRKLVRMFGDKAKLIRAEGYGASYDDRIFGEDDIGVDDISRDSIQLFEYWEKNDEDKLRLVYCTKDMILMDSDDYEGEDSIIPQENDEYPFVPILGYKKKGRFWGIGDTEMLMNTQDLINDLDDQIRLNARLTGNPQTVVNTTAGINLKKWTNKAGLKIPAKDHTAFQVIQPAYMPAYINNRREKGFYEKEIISGRSEVVEGRRSGSLRAASALLALQEAGSRRANHKKLMLQEGLSKVENMKLKYAKEFMTTEQAYDITENGETNYLWFRASDLKAIPQLTLNENYTPESDDIENRSRYKPLYDEPTVDENGLEVEGKPMTKDAEFDIEVQIGAGMPNNKSFIYEATVELHRENIVTTEEARDTLKTILNWPIIDPYAPSGSFNGRNSSAEQLAMANGQTVPGQKVPGQTVEGQTQPNQTAPTLDANTIQQLQELSEMVKSGQVSPEVLKQALAQLPPETLQVVAQYLQGG